MRFAGAIASLLTLAVAAKAATIHEDLVQAGLLKDKIWSCQCGCECLDDECHKPDCGEGTYFPHPEDCGSFCQCSNGKAYYHACPDGLMFNPALNVCDWPENVCCNAPVNPHICADHGCYEECETTTTCTPPPCETTTCTPPPCTTTTTCTPPPCTTTTTCTPPPCTTTSTCPPTTTTCTPPPCTTTSTCPPTTTTCTPPPCTTTSTCPPTTTTCTPPPCTTTSTCPPTTTTCTPPPCTTTTTCTPPPCTTTTTCTPPPCTTTTTCTPPPCTTTPTCTTQPPCSTTENPCLDGLCANQCDGTFLENPLDCGAFIRCDHGQEFYFDCPEGTLWDQCLLTCNHAGQVNCGDRPQRSVPENE